mmetsp:Transcript_4592/g.7054  ORF Transcript_4592/g.7054 Transcript_4592/m.7054 type:complete len:96 (+) Transcript_4592:3990-4277(+)
MCRNRSMSPCWKMLTTHLQCIVARQWESLRFSLDAVSFFAIKDAITAARGREGGYFEFRLPATSERIRMACGDVIASECISSDRDQTSFQPQGSF